MQAKSYRTTIGRISADLPFHTRHKSSTKALVIIRRASLSRCFSVHPSRVTVCAFRRAYISPYGPAGPDKSPAFGPRHCIRNIESAIVQISARRCGANPCFAAISAPALRCCRSPSITASPSRFQTRSLVAYFARSPVSATMIVRPSSANPRTPSTQGQTCSSRASLRIRFFGKRPMFVPCLPGISGVNDDRSADGSGI